MAPHHSMKSTPFPSVTQPRILEPSSNMMHVDEPDFAVPKDHSLREVTLPSIDMVGRSSSPTPESIDQPQGIEGSIPSYQSLYQAALDAAQNRRDSGSGIADAHSADKTPANVESIEVDDNSLLPFGIVKELSCTDQDFHSQVAVGEGQWGVVTKGNFREGEPTSARDKPLQANRVYALKAPRSQEASRIMEWEAQIMTYLSRSRYAYDYMVEFYGRLASGTLIFSYASSGLQARISDLQSEPAPLRARYVRYMFSTLASGLVNGLQWMHSKGVIHGDIKPANILLDVERLDGGRFGWPLYCDFSAAVQLPDIANPNNRMESAYAGGNTWDYMAPELCQRGAKTTFATDVWALGMTLLEFVLGKLPLANTPVGPQKRELLKQGDHLIHLLQGPRSRARWEQSDFQPQEGDSEPTVNLQECIKVALKKKPEDRITATEWAIWLYECYRRRRVQDREPAELEPLATAQQVSGSSDGSNGNSNASSDTV